MSTGLLYRVPPEEARKALVLAAISLKARQRIEKSWPELARPEQRLPPGDWRTWLILAGRGWGKTRTAAEAFAEWIKAGLVRRTALAAQTAADARDVSVPALLKALGPAAVYEPSKRLVSFREWRGITFSAEDPDSFRGYEHDSAMIEEVASWRFPEAFDQLQYALRAGEARQIVTTTPRPVRVLRELMAERTTVITRGRTLENAANLSPSALAYLLARYEGTRLGRQELDAEILEDVPGALWTRAMIEEAHVQMPPGWPDPKYRRVVVAIDPAVTAEEGSDETGIVVAGTHVDGRAYVLSDLSTRASPKQWAQRAVDAYRAHRADRIVAEVNNGGDLVEEMIRVVDPNVAYRAVHASKGKRTRAEPVSALYEQRRVSHVGTFSDLEDQLCTWAPDKDASSPDRLDALVWALSELVLETADGTSWAATA